MMYLNIPIVYLNIPQLLDRLVQSLTKRHLSVRLCFTTLKGSELKKNTRNVGKKGLGFRDDFCRLYFSSGLANDVSLKPKAPSP